MRTNLSVISESGSTTHSEYIWHLSLVIFSYYFVGELNRFGAFCVFSDDVDFILCPD